MGSEAEVCADEQVIIPMSAGPATPEAEEKGGGEHHNLKHHHFSSPPPPPPPWGNYNGLETPKETLFDSFAPASAKFLLAPYHRKYREESRTHVVRRLDFTKDLTFTCSCGCDEQQEEKVKEEERMFEIVYGTIMDAILAEQQQQQQSQGGGTPKSAPFLNGIADTCPAAPLKSARKHRFIDKEICKKLEF